jgi:hypothetical protein
MKATLIISSEYKHNQPSVFIFVEGRYFGSQIYPQGRNYPQDVNYWSNATSSDSDRYFSLQDVEYSDEDFSLIENLQNSIFANEKLLKEFPRWKPSPKYTIKRGKAYQACLAFENCQNKEITEVSEYNAPYDRAITAAKNQLRIILLSVK